jgi:hypothetical protein
MMLALGGRVGERAGAAKIRLFCRIFKQTQANEKGGPRRPPFLRSGFWKVPGGAGGLARRIL